MEETSERAILEAELGGSWVSFSSGLGPGGPARLWRSQDAIAFVGSAARIAAEREGWARLADHPARPSVLRVSEHAILFVPFGDAVSDPIAFVSRWPRSPRTVHGTRRELLKGLSAPGERDVARALTRLGIARRTIDRWLDVEAAFETHAGLSFGGIHPAYFREQSGRAVSIRCDAVRDGWEALDRAGVELDGRFRDDELRSEARDLARVLVFTRELGFSRDQELESRVRAIVEDAQRKEPERVRVFIEGPPFLDPHRWHAPGELVSASRARWLLAELDGLHFGGGRIEVRTDPPIRKGRRSPHREPREQRRRRLFSRWDEGIRADDEGLLSATPEAIALSIARGAHGVVLDGTCGIGSLAIAYARQPEVKEVIAVDLDADRLAMARHNAAVYGVADRIRFVQGDIEKLVASTRADLLVVDPPWGGRDYDRERVTLGDLSLDLASILARFENEVVLKLPRSFDVSSLPAGGWRFEPAIDERGILKMLVARRAGFTSCSG